MYRFNSAWPSFCCIIIYSRKWKLGAKQIQIPHSVSILKLSILQGLQQRIKRRWRWVGYYRKRERPNIRCSDFQSLPICASLSCLTRWGSVLACLILKTHPRFHITPILENKLVVVTAVYAFIDCLLLTSLSRYYISTNSDPSERHLFR